LPLTVFLRVITPDLRYDTFMNVNDLGHTDPLMSYVPLPATDRWRLRPVERGDLWGLLADCWRDYDRNRARALVERAIALYDHCKGMGVVAVEQNTGAILSYGQIMRWSRSAEISDLVVSPSWRSQGIGTAMIYDLMRYAPSMRVRQIEIGVAEANPRALALYRRLGFEDSYTVMLDVGYGMEKIIYLTRNLDR